MKVLQVRAFTIAKIGEAKLRIGMKTTGRPAQVALSRRGQKMGSVFLVKEPPMKKNNLKKLKCPLYQSLHNLFNRVLILMVKTTIYLIKI